VDYEACQWHCPGCDATARLDFFKSKLPVISMRLGPGDKSAVLTRILLSQTGCRRSRQWFFLNSFLYRTVSLWLLSLPSTKGYRVRHMAVEMIIVRVPPSIIPATHRRNSSKVCHHDSVWLVASNHRVRLADTVAQKFIQSKSTWISCVSESVDWAKVSSSIWSEELYIITYLTSDAPAS